MAFDGIGDRGSKAIGEVERLAKFAVVELIDAQPPQRAQQIVVVAELLGQPQRLAPGRTRLARPADAIHQRPAARRRQLHADARGVRTGLIKPCQRQLGALAAFRQQRQLHPERDGGRRQRRAGLRVAVAREGPVETGADIVDVPAVDGEPLGLRLQFALGFRVRKEAAVISGVPAGDVVIFAAVIQLLLGVDARGIQQAIMRPVASDIGNDERFCHEVGEMVGDVVARGIAGDGAGGLHQEIAGEDAELAQQARLPLGQQVVAPVECRAQRALPGQRRAAAGGEIFEPVVEQRRDFRRVEHDRARRRKLDRERDAVEPPADGGDRAEILLVMPEVRAQRLGAGHEQLDRGVIERAFGGGLQFRRHAERRDAIDMLAVDAQPFAAGGENDGARAAGDDGLDQPRHGIDDMLAIVENEQQAPRADRARNRLRRNLLAFLLDGEHAGDRRRHQARIGQRRQFDQQPVGIVSRRRRSCRLQRQRRLADAARPDQADDPIGRQ